MDSSDDRSHRLSVLLLADPTIPVPPRHYGGIERIIDMICRGLIDRGHEVALVAHADSTVECRLFRLPKDSGNSLREKLGSAWVIYRAVRRFKPDVIHSFARLAYLWPLLRTQTPKIMSYQREPTLARISKTAKLARKRTFLVTGCSDYITNKIRPIALAETVYNGVPTSRFTFRDRVDADAPLVFLGRIEKIKGTHNAIEIAKATGKRLIIAGNVPDDLVSQSYFELAIKPHLNDRIRYVGPVDDQQKNEILGAALAMVMAIEWDEPFGIVMVESLACGTPILGFPRGAVAEVVDDGHTGFIRETVADLIESVPKLSTISRQNCRNACESRFCENVIVDEYMKIYRRMLGFH